MLVSDHARMLAVAPGGWDRCLCRSCRPYNSGAALSRSARRLERRSLAEEIAEALAQVAEDAPKSTPEIVGTSHLWEWDEEPDGGIFRLDVEPGFASAEWEPPMLCGPWCDLCY